MPVIAVGAALVADVVAGAAIAGTVGGIAAISATTAFEIAAAVGATIAAVGVVARDKTLTMVGGVIGAIGGIGGLASSAGLFGAEAASSAPIFGAAPAAAASDTAASGSATFADSLTPATAGTTGGPIDAGAFDVAGAAADNASAGTIPAIANELPGGDGYTSLSTTAQTVPDPATALAGPRAASPGTDTPNSLLNGGAGASSASPADIPLPPPAPPAGGDINPATGQLNVGSVDPATGKVAFLPDSSNGVFGKIFDFANNNKVVTLGALQTGGKLLEGAFSTLTPAQVSALNAQAAANQAAANMADQQRINLAAPKAVASSAPVTGTPQPILPSTGLINSAPKLANVTGVPT